MKNEFKIGDKVRWKSQANGSWTEKVGTVVCVLNPKKTRSTKGYVDKFPNHLKMFDGGRFYNQTDTYYLVEVLTGPKSKPRLYFPRPSSLKAVNE